MTIRRPAVQRRIPGMTAILSPQIRRGRTAMTWSRFTLDALAMDSLARVRVVPGLSGKKNLCAADYLDYVTTLVADSLEGVRATT